MTDGGTAGTSSRGSGRSLRETERTDHREKGMKTHIYTAVDSSEIRRGDRRYGYVITAEGREQKRQDIGIVDGTYHEASLKAVTEALDRFDPAIPCEIEIHCEDKFVTYHAEHSLENKWQFCGWKNSRGKEIANRDLWQLLYNMIRIRHHRITFTGGKHKYSEYLRQAMKEEDNPAREMPV